jgi:hypothetical protein
MPGNVMTAPIYAISPSRMIRFNVSAMTALTPDKW